MQPALRTDYARRARRSSRFLRRDTGLAHEDLMESANATGKQEIEGKLEGGESPVLGNHDPEKCPESQNDRPLPDNRNRERSTALAQSVLEVGIEVLGVEVEIGQYLPAR